MKIGMLTGGGDCPGLNAVIRAVAKNAISNYGIEVMGILDGYWGLVAGYIQPLTNKDVSGILHTGGTILGTSRVDPFREAYKRGFLPSPTEDWGYVKSILATQEIDALVAIGGEGTLGVAARMHRNGIPVVGVPKTIDNDVDETDFTFGFDSAVSIVMNALDNLHSTAMSHHRAMVVEVMGRTAGWLALYGGVAGGGDILLLPEFPYDEKILFQRVLEREKSGKRFSIIVVAEGAKPAGGTEIFSGKDDGSGRQVLGGIGKYVADRIEANTGLDARVTVLGHLQRGGGPTGYDRVLATQFGYHAMEILAQSRSGEMVALKGSTIKAVPLEKAVGKIKRVPKGHPLISAAQAVGTSFGIAECLT